ncbi:MAG: hypothetical protein IPG23_28105 [Burkholderiales bacterium]|nr:hypothetical protein [Burkholderiales bacterium]
MVFVLWFRSGDKGSTGKTGVVSVISNTFEKLSACVARTADGVARVLRLAAWAATLALQRYCVNTACGAPASGQPRVRPAPAGHTAGLELWDFE